MHGQQNVKISKDVLPKYLIHDERDLQYYFAREPNEPHLFSHSELHVLYSSPNIIRGDEL